MNSGEREKNGDTVNLLPDGKPLLESVGSSPVVEARGTELAVRPSGPSQALVAAVRTANERRRFTKAENTLRGYQNDWERFLEWAMATQAVTLPASPDVVCAHLEWLADEGYGVATIERFLAAGKHYHQAAGVDFPRGVPAVTGTLASIRRRPRAQTRKKAALGPEALVAACERLRQEAEHRGTPDVGLQQRAMLTVGWFCTIRSANLVAIRRSHVRLVRLEGREEIDDVENPNAFVLHIPRSKTDQEWGGHDIPVHAQSDERACPVQLLAAHLRAHDFAPDDLIFPVSERTVSRLIKRVVSNPAHGHKTFRDVERCESCSAAARRFASHSLRRGSATEFAKQGVPERDIMRHGGWKNERVMRGYIEQATLFDNNPTKNLVRKDK